MDVRTSEPLLATQNVPLFEVQTQPVGFQQHQAMDLSIRTCKETYPSQSAAVTKVAESGIKMFFRLSSRLEGGACNQSELVYPPPPPVIASLDM